VEPQPRTSSTSTHWRAPLRKIKTYPTASALSDQAAKDTAKEGRE